MLMTALGGWFWPLARLGPSGKLGHERHPTRWAFEGLLLLESPYHPSPPPPINPLPPPIAIWLKTISLRIPSGWVPAPISWP